MIDAIAVAILLTSAVLFLGRCFFRLGRQPAGSASACSGCACGGRDRDLASPAAHRAARPRPASTGEPQRAPAAAAPHLTLHGASLQPASPRPPLAG